MATGRSEPDERPDHDQVQPRFPRILSPASGISPRPIRGDHEHRRVIEVVNDLLDRPALTSDEEDYLDVLGLLIADYEDSIYEHRQFSPVERLRHLLEEHAWTQAELARRAGIAVTSLSDILNGQRRISPQIRAKLAECFGVSATFFA